MAGFLGGFRSMASVGVRIIALPKPLWIIGQFQFLPDEVQPFNLLHYVEFHITRSNSSVLCRTTRTNFFSPSMQSAWNLRTPFAWMCRLLRKINGGCQRESVGS